MSEKVFYFDIEHKEKLSEFEKILNDSFSCFGGCLKFSLRNHEDKLYLCREAVTQVSFDKDDVLLNAASLSVIDSAVTHITGKLGCGCSIEVDKGIVGVLKIPMAQDGSPVLAFCEDHKKAANEYLSDAAEDICTKTITGAYHFFEGHKQVILQKKLSEDSLLDKIEAFYPIYNNLKQSGVFEEMDHRLEKLNKVSEDLSEYRSKDSSLKRRVEVELMGTGVFLLR